jgi:hypothetical protein
MDTKFGWRAWIKAAGVLLSLLFAAYTTASNFSDLPLPKLNAFSGYLAAAFLFVLFIYLHFIDLQRRIDSYETPKLNVVPGSVRSEHIPTILLHYIPFPLTDQVTDQGGEPRKESLTGTYATYSTYTTVPLQEIPNDPKFDVSSRMVFEGFYLTFRNKNQPHRKIRDAEHVYAELIFKSQDKERLIENAVWGSSRLPSATGNIKTNEELENLYLVIREQNGKGLYIYCMDSYSYSSKNNLEPLRDNLLLDQKHYLIDIKLTDKGGWKGEYAISLDINEGQPVFGAPSSLKTRNRSAAHR